MPRAAISVATKVLTSPSRKALKRAFALALRFVAVNRLGVDAGMDQAAHDLVGAMLRPGEDQGPVDRLPPQHVDEHRKLGAALDTNDALFDALDRRGDRRYGDLDRVAQHLRGEFGDGARHCRREHQRLPPGRKLGDDRADVVDEAHVEHSVGLVEHETFDLAQAQRIASDEIEQPAGRCDENVNAVKQRANLPAHRYAADRQRRPQAQVAAVRAEAVEDLAGQFARRAEHQHPASLAPRLPGIGREMMENRQSEGGGFAGPGLGNSDHVAAGHDDRDGLHLDRSG